LVYKIGRFREFQGGDIWDIGVDKGRGIEAGEFRRVGGRVIVRKARDVVREDKSRDLESRREVLGGILRLKVKILHEREAWEKMK